MKGILFKPWKIKAIADSPLDREWQTRRVIKLPVLTDGYEWRNEGNEIYAYKFHPEDLEVNAADECVPYPTKPRYQVGETVYIKEAYAHIGNEYRAGKVYAMVKYLNDLREIPFEGERHIQKWWNTGKPVGYMQNPRTMPAWAARYFIKITDVRAERLQEIGNTPGDYKAEGYTPLILGKSAIDGKPFEASADFAWYENLWDTINKPPYDWQSNPWVFVYSFKRVEGK